jgi:hypothetical protein
MSGSKKTKPTNKGISAKEVASKPKIVQPIVEASSSDSEDEQKSTTGDPSEDVSDLRSSDDEGAPEKEVNQEPDKREEEIIFQSYQQFQAEKQQEELEKFKTAWESNPLLRQHFKAEAQKYHNQQNQQKLAATPATPQKGSAESIVEQARLAQVENLKGPSAATRSELTVFAEIWKRRISQHPDMIRTTDLINRLHSSLWYTMKSQCPKMGDSTPEQFIATTLKEFPSKTKTIPKSTVTISNWASEKIKQAAESMRNGKPQLIPTAIFDLVQKLHEEATTTFCDEIGFALDDPNSSAISRGIAKAMRKAKGSVCNILITRMEKAFEARPSSSSDTNATANIDDLNFADFAKLMMTTTKELEVVVEIYDLLQAACASKPSNKNDERNTKDAYKQSGSDKEKRKASSDKHASNGTQPKKARKEDKHGPCTTCGRQHAPPCRFKGHPNANQTSTAWSESASGKAFAAVGKDVLPWDKQLVNGKLTAYQNPKGKDEEEQPSTSMFCIDEVQSAGSDQTVEHHYGQSTQQMDIDHVQEVAKNVSGEPLSLPDLIEIEDGLIWADVVTSKAAAPHLRYNEPADSACYHRVKTLIDTGANPLSFANCRVKEIWQRFGGRVDKCDKTVQVGPSKYQVTECITVPLRMANFAVGKLETFSIELHILPMTHDIVFGKQAIRERPALKSILFHDLMTLQDLEWMGAHITKWKRDHANASSTGGTNESSANPVQNEMFNIIPLDDRPGLASNKPTVDDNDDDGQDDADGEAELPTELGEDPELREALIKLLNEFKTCFSSKLRPEAARVPPMDLKVADSWDRRENRQPARYQTAEKQEFISSHTGDLQGMGVIRESLASAHSQIHLTRKPDQTWRFCCDFRRLNAATQAQTWPLPNIEEMLQRIGQKKPKYLATIDLRHGYWQLPLSESSRHYTAFITATALYEWCRVPMGLQGASAYFQRTMQTIVLPGLLHSMCEVYLDDLIVWGSTREEYLANLRRVLERLKKFGITAGPKKCKLGQTRLEYVGHIIDQEGVEFKRERLQEIIDFDRPTKLGELKTFLGLATYVRKNTSHRFADTAAPLHKLLGDYTKKKKNHSIVWTQESIAAFEALKELINNSQKLFFYNSKSSEVKLYTDASKFGIGAVLVQVVDGEEQVVAFMSRTLNKAQLNYSTVEREALAIAEAFKKFEYLLRNVHFKLFTDHKNLCHIRDSGSPRVIAYKMLIQEFDFEIDFIEGAKNTGADFMSRNRAAEVLPEEPEPHPVTNLDTMELDPLLPVRENEFMCAIAAQLHIPTQQQYDAMVSCHNAVVGHNGVEQTIQRLNDAGQKWKYRRPMVERFIKECDVCQKNAPRVGAKMHVKPYTLSSWALMEDRSVDFVGPLSEDVDGNKYICVIIDTFSRWVELYKCKEPTAEAAAEALLDHFGRFGAPKSLRSDKGSAFTGELIEQFLERVGVKHNLSIADSHQENGIVEAANAEVRRYLNDIGYDKQLHLSHWSKSLPFAQRIQNSMSKTMTGLSPAYMLYAGGLDLNHAIIPGIDQPELSKIDAVKGLQPWIAARQETQRRAIDVAQKRIREHELEHQLTDTGQRTEFPVGSLVLRSWAPNQYGTKPNKSSLNYSGPFEVLSFEGQTYILRDTATGKATMPINIHRLRPYRHDPERTNPVQVRGKDKGMYIVEKIIDFTGSLKRKKSLRFRVKWEGYEDPTEEPWENVRDCAPLHKYLSDIGKAQFIPDKFYVNNIVPA